MKTNPWQLKLNQLYKQMQGSKTEYKLETYLGTINLIHQAVDEFKLLSEQERYEQALSLKQKALSGIPLNDLLAPTFALTYLATETKLGITPHDEQLIAAIAMHDGKLAELQTGEGKTLAAVFTAILNSLAGKGVHILTFNDYLARRDAHWMRPIYQAMGVGVGVIQQSISITERQTNYNCDVTYLTAKEAGFDFLRDSLVYDPTDIVQRQLNFALVDEADSILIDEARIPLVIAEAEAAYAGDKNYAHLRKLANWVQELEYGTHFESDDQFRNIHLTSAGAEFFQTKLNCTNLYDEDSLPQLTLINHALHAEYLLHKDIDYIVRGKNIELVDDYTGRVANQRRWPNGIQQALEAKEGLIGGNSTNITNTITLQHHIKQYKKIAGMTATAVASEEEFNTVYQLPIVCIPPHFPSQRIDHPDLVFTTEKAKRDRIITEIKHHHSNLRPVLVGTANIEESMALYKLLQEHQIPCQVLNARRDEQEAHIIAQAGTLGAVTISTNMAGRGTDILLGAGDPIAYEKVKALGGLHVIGTEKHETRRIDQQLKGRAGRQGDPGSSQFIISLEDGLFRAYPLDVYFPYLEKLLQGHKSEQEPISRSELLHCIHKIQTIAEEQNWQIKYTLCKYARLVDQQRHLFFLQRNECLHSPQHCNQQLTNMAQNEVDRIKPFIQTAEMESLAQRLLLRSIDYVWSLYLEEISAIKENIHLTRLSGKEPLDLFQEQIICLYRDLETFVAQRAQELLGLIEIKNNKVLLPEKEMRTPANTWTYLINDHFFADELQNALVSSSGFAASVAGIGTPFLMIYLLLKRHLQKIRPGLREGS